MTTSKLVLSLALLPALFAQSERGSIAGIVTDPSGAAVASAEVVVTQRGRRMLLSGRRPPGAGEYSVPNLLPGVVPRRGERARFQAVDSAECDRGGLHRRPARHSVAARAGFGASGSHRCPRSVVQTDDAKVSTQVQNKMVDELPLVVAGAMRSPFNLVAVVPEARGSGQRLSLGGGQVAQWDATLDGYSVGTNRSGDTDEAALNTPSVEALTEFTVDTNGFKAEYGQAGGGTMTFASKSGTNKFHGSAYDFLRNDALDARGFFAQTRSVYRQNDYGATASGPVWIPKLYNGRDKTFFFVSYEGFRNRVGANNTILTVPTPEMYKGDFRNWVDQNNKLITIYDPATTARTRRQRLRPRRRFPAIRFPRTVSRRPLSAIATFGQAVLPNLGFAPGTSRYVRQNYIVTGGTMITPTDKWSVKGDQVIGSKQRVSLLWNATTFRNKPGPSGPPGLPQPLWNGQIQAWDTEAFRVAHDWTISPHMVNHFSWARNTFTKNSYSGNVDQNWKSKVCIKNVIDCNQNFPTINFTEFTALGLVLLQRHRPAGLGNQERPQLHSRLAHVEVRLPAPEPERQRLRPAGHRGPRRLQFPEHQHSGQHVISRQRRQFLRVVPAGRRISRAHRDHPLCRAEVRYFGFYAQDDWRITRKLTVNLGLRYDVTLPPINAKDEYSDFNPTRPNPGADGYPGALWFAGFGPGRENTRSLVPGWYGGIGPRLGVAYAVDAKTTIRAGFGRSFSRVTAVQGSGHFAGFIGQYQFDNTSQGVTPTFKLDQGLPPYKLPPSIDPAFSNGNTVDWWQGQDATRAPENLNWTLTIQRQVANNMVIEAGYNASVGTHMQSGILNYNQVPTADLRPDGRAVRRHAGAQHPALEHHFGHGRRGGNPEAVSELHRHRGAGSPALPAVHHHQHRTAERRQERPFLLSRADHEAGPPPLAGSHAAMELRALQAPDGFRHLLRQLRDRGAGPIQPAPGEIDRPVRPDARLQVLHALRPAVRERAQVDESRVSDACHRAAGAFRRSRCTPAASRSRSSATIRCRFSTASRAR